MKTRREIERAARAAGPWTPEAEEAAASLRNLSARATLTDAERDAFRVLRQREINESVRRQRVVWPATASVRPLKRIASGHYVSADGRWTFLRSDDWDPHVTTWHAFEEGFDEAFGSASLTLRDQVADVEAELASEARRAGSP